MKSVQASATIGGPRPVRGVAAVNGNTHREHSHALLIRRLFSAFREGDLPAVLDSFDEAAVWHFPGRDGHLAGEHRGRDAIIDFMLKVTTLTDGTFDAELVDVIANDTHTVALVHGRGYRNGRWLENPICLRMRVDHGEIIEVWEYVWNLYDVDAFWS